MLKILLIVVLFGFGLILDTYGQDPPTYLINSPILVGTHEADPLIDPSRTSSPFLEASEPVETMDFREFLSEQCAPAAEDACYKDHMRLYVCSALQNMVNLVDWLGRMQKSAEGCAAASSEEMMSKWMNAISCPETKSIMCTKPEMLACANVTAACKVCACRDGGYTNSDWKVIFDIWKDDTFNRHNIRMEIFRTLKEQCTGTSTSTCG